MGGNILRVGYRMGFNTIEFVTGRVTGRVSKKAKKGDIRLSDNWFSDNCPALVRNSGQNLLARHKLTIIK